MKGNLHPSLQAFIDCFDSPPFPRMWPRGGGIYDQDPILVRDFRMIREFEVKWKNAQREMAAVDQPAPEEPQGDSTDVEDLLNQYIEEQGLEGDSVF